MLNIDGGAAEKFCRVLGPQTFDSQNHNHSWQRKCEACEVDARDKISKPNRQICTILHVISFGLQTFLNMALSTLPFSSKQSLWAGVFPAGTCNTFRFRIGVVEVWIKVWCLTFVEFSWIFYIVLGWPKTKMCGGCLCYCILIQAAH